MSIIDCISFVLDYYQKKKSITEIEQIIQKENFQPVCKQLVYKPSKIAFVLLDMSKGSGGCTSVLRIGRSLARNYEITYSIVHENTEKSFMDAAEYNLKGWRGSYISFSKLREKGADIVIATSWQTAYAIKEISGYKMYFLQDYEPLFGDYGEMYYLAKETYMMGYHMVSLGGWNAYMVQRECNVKVQSVIDFPYEPGEYPYVKRDFAKYKDKAQIKIAVYVKPAARRIPYMIQAMMELAKDEFETKTGKELQILYFGMKKIYRTTGGKNLGVLPKEKLHELYQSADFGMVASMTNISLIPLEMMATGLPIIEFRSGTFPFFFGEENAILTDFNPHVLCTELIDYIGNPQKISALIENSQRSLGNLDWNKSCEQFQQIISNLTED